MNQDNDSDLEIAEQSAAPGGVRGKYYANYKEGTNVVLLAPESPRSFATPRR